MSEAVRTLRFHYGLYSGQAVEQTCAAFGVCADVEFSQEEPHYIVALTSPKDGADLNEIADEFGNFALGLTIEERRAGS